MTRPERASRPTGSFVRFGGAYVVMPEHVHLLVWPTEAEYDISRILNSIKQSVAKRALMHVRRHAAGFLTRMADRQPNGNVH